MYFAKILSLILVIRGCKHVYDKLNEVIINKIENKDYGIIKRRNFFFEVLLGFDENDNILSIKLSIQLSNIDIRPKFKNIKVNCNYKSIDDIVKEIEHILFEAYKEKVVDSIILIYNLKFNESNYILKKIINNIKKENIVRKKRPFHSDICYVNIIENNALIAITSSKTKRYFYYIENKIYDQCIQRENIKNSNINSIWICIYIDQIYYFFELDIKELGLENLYFSNITKKVYDNENDDKVFQYLYELYLYANIENFDTCIGTFLPLCTINDVLIIGNNFTIELKNQEIVFLLDSGDYYYSFKEKTAKNIKILFEFQELLVKISMILKAEEKFKCVELFFRITENNIYLKLLVDRILFYSRTSLRIIFTHLLLIEKILDETELKKIIANEALSEKRKIQILKDTLRILLKYECLSSTYTMKICLFLEAEISMNEDDVISNSLFGTLKKIAKIIADKKTQKNNFNELIETSDKVQVDLLTIYEEIYILHIDNIKNMKEIVSEYVFQVILLFTESVHNIGVNLSNKTDKVFTRSWINENEIEKNNDIIRKKLIDKSHEDKNIEKIKKILEIESEKKLRKALNTIQYHALNKFVKNLYDDKIYMNFENNYKTQGYNLIDNVLIYDDKTRKLLNYSKINVENLINSFKNCEKEKFYKRLKYYMKENLRRNVKPHFFYAMMEFFESEINNEICNNARHKINIENIKSKFSEYDVLELLNMDFGIKIHEVLIKSLENKNQ
ncbi:uncharacterized protein VNE69_06243 [Vairimorpha necatrix]|uniref:Uncharacterized protein n=1 Tax=Vairimorpha necatrix TaxID=6039 RepID=A0AAX4JD73_9MICR